MTPIVELQSVGKDYGAFRALHSLDLELNQGEVLGFLGPNGAGKTTTIRIVLGLLRATRGSARLFGRDCWRDAVAERRRLGYLPGDVRLYDGHTGASLLRLLARLRARDADERERMLERALEISRRLDFDPKKRVRAYSKGNKQKLGLVQAMMHSPDVLILDEPTSALDPLMQERVYELLRERSAAGVSVLFSSHVLSEVEKVCDRVAILRAGRLLETTAVGDIEQLRWRKVRLESVGVAELENLLRARGLETKSEGPVLETLIRGEIGWLVQTLAQFPIESLSIEPLSIEEIFFDSYRSADDPLSESGRANRDERAREPALGEVGDGCRPGQGATR